ncbi:MAG: Ribonuclease Z, partial [uncultured Microvirga sp.]
GARFRRHLARGAEAARARPQRHRRRGAEPSARGSFRRPALPVARPPVQQSARKASHDHRAARHRRAAARRAGSVLPRLLAQPLALPARHRRPAVRHKPSLRRSRSHHPRGEASLRRALDRGAAWRRPLDAGLFGRHELDGGAVQDFARRRPLHRRMLQDERRAAGASRLRDHRRPPRAVRGRPHDADPYERGRPRPCRGAGGEGLSGGPGWPRPRNL